MIDIVIEVIGWSGAVMILVAYLLLTTGKIAAASVTYQALNLVGALAFVLNSGWNGAIPSATLNVIWAGIAVYALTRIAAARRT